MGLRASWFAARGADEAEMLAALGFEEAGEIEIPLEERYSFCRLPGGWSVVVADQYDWASGRDLAALVPSAAETFACNAYAVVMVSGAWGDKDGVRVWSIEHDPESDQDLKIEGRPPAALAEIHRRLAAEQAADRDGGVDYMFDAPSELSKALCGFHPEEELPEGAKATKLVPIGSSMQPSRRRSGGLFGALKGLFGSRP